MLSSRGHLRSADAQVLVDTVESIVALIDDDPDVGRHIGKDLGLGSGPEYFQSMNLLIAPQSD